MWEFLPSTELCECPPPRGRGSGMPALVYLLPLLRLSSLPYQFICFFASSCVQISLVAILLEGVLRYLITPRFEKARSYPFDHFRSNAPPSFVPTFIRPPPRVGKVLITPQVQVYVAVSWHQGGTTSFDFI